MDEFEIDLSQWDWSDIAIELHLLRDYLTMMEEFFTQETKNYHDAQQEGIRNGTIYVWGDSGPEPSYESIMLDQLPLFEDKMRKSLFVSLFSLLESTLLDECEARRRADPDVVLELDELRGANDIKKARDYFRKVLRLDFPDTGAEWAAIIDYERLRDCIVHARSTIDKFRAGRRDALQRFVAGNKSLTLWGDETELIIEKGFCEEVITMMETFFQSWLYPNNSYRFANRTVE